MKKQPKNVHQVSKQYLLIHHSVNLQNKQMEFHFVNYIIKLNPNIKQQKLNDVGDLRRKKFVLRLLQYPNLLDNYKLKMGVSVIIPKR